MTRVLLLCTVAVLAIFAVGTSAQNTADACAGLNADECGLKALCAFNKTTSKCQSYPCTKRTANDCTVSTIKDHPCFMYGRQCTTCASTTTTAGSDGTSQTSCNTGCSTSKTATGSISCVRMCATYTTAAVCQGFTSCAWNSTTSKCDTKSSTGTNTNTSTTPTSCGKMSAEQCKGDLGAKYHCFVYAGMCATCSEANTCNEKTCVMMNQRCHRKCQTYATAATCPTTTCQHYTYTSSNTVGGSTTSTSFHCVDMPMCSLYKNMTTCKLDYKCAVQQSSSSTTAGTDGTTTTTATCVAKCSAWKNSDNCVAKGCAWNSTTNFCADKPAPTPTSCGKMSAEQCKGDLGAKYHCFVYAGMCATCSEANTCNEKTCVMMNQRCHRKCQTYATAATCPTTTCQHYTATTSGTAAGTKPAQAFYCVDMPMCSLYKNMTTCKLDYKCAVQQSSSSTTAGTDGTTTTTATCVAKCSAWKNSDNCVAKGCAWNSTTNFCADKPAPTPTMSCFAMVPSECMGEMGKGLNCFVYSPDGKNQRCASCSEANTCNEKTCVMMGGRCHRSCTTYNTAATCPKATCQHYTYTSPNSVTGSSTFYCKNMPKCSFYKNMTTCHNDWMCAVTKTGTTTGSDTVATCTTKCNAWVNAELCAAKGCYYNVSQKYCVPKSSNTDPITKPPTNGTVTTCWNMNLEQCKGDMGIKKHCFVINGMCATCTADPDIQTFAPDCNEKVCQWIGGVCSRKCLTFSATECANAKRCQTVAQTDASVAVVGGAHKCADMPICSLYKNMTLCRSDMMCSVTQSSSTTTDGSNTKSGSTTAATCSTLCHAWKNPVLCQAQTSCAWNKTYSKCLSSVTPAPPTNDTTVSCWKLTASQCESDKARMLGCFVINGMCATCTEKDACNEKVCERVGAMCVRKCVTFATASTCPEKRCQSGATQKMETGAGTTIAISCFPMPICSLYKNMTLCKLDRMCSVHSSSSATTTGTDSNTGGVATYTCAVQCPAWRNADRCGADTRCYWNKTKSICWNKNSDVHPTPAPTVAPILSCWKLTEAQCASERAQQLGCFVVNGMCATCTEKNACNEKTCAMFGTRCIRKCSTFSATACPVAHCQMITPPPNVRMATTCGDRPLCILYGKNTTLCKLDTHCDVKTISSSTTGSNTAAGSDSTTSVSYCVAKCASWRNAGTCAADAKCSWNTLTNVCGVATITRATVCSKATDMKSCYYAAVPCYWNARSTSCLPRPCMNRTATQCQLGEGEKLGCFNIPAVKALNFHGGCSACNQHSCDSKACVLAADGSCDRRCWTYSLSIEACKAADNCAYNYTTRSCVQRREITPVKPTAITCADRDSETCGQSKACSWDRVSATCKDLACSAHPATTCPVTRCIIREKMCVDVCPKSAPVYCRSTKVCAESLDKCVTCSSTETLCWNSKCAGSLNDCDCPPRRPHRCEATKLCVADATSCANQTKCDGKLCWDGSCIASDSADGASCPCPASSPARCSDNRCALSSTRCAATCAGDTPYKCWNGKCSTGATACPCPTDAPHRCSSTGKCAVSEKLCGCAEGLTKCPDDRCASSCAITCSTRAKPYRCQDGSCSADAASCPCPTRAWANAIVTTRIQAAASSSVTVEANRKHRIGASAMAVVCHSKREMIAKFKWTLHDNTAKTFVKLPDAVGSVLEASTSILTPGHEYTLTVVAVLVKDGLKLAKMPSGTSSVTFTARKPARAVVILGGGERVVSASDKLVVAVDPRKLGASVDQKGTFTGMPAVQWSCKCLTTGCTACPAAILTALTSSTKPKIDISASVTSKLPAGKYNITARIVSSSNNDDDGDLDAGDKIVASQIVEIQPSVVAKAQVGIFGVPSSKALLSSLRTVVLYARTNNRNATLIWYINGAKAGTGRTLTFPQTRLIPGTTFFVRVTAHFGGSSASAKTQFKVPSTKISGTCSVALAAEDSTTSTIIESLKTPIVISTTWKGVDATQLRFRYGYYLNRGRVWLSPSSSELSSMKLLAPMVSGANAAAKKTYFVVVARLADSKSDVAYAKCSLDIVPSSDDKAKDEIAKGLRRIKESTASNDTSRLAQLVASLSGAAKKLTDAKKKRDAQALAVRAAEAIANATKRALSRTERSTIIQGVRSAMDSENEDDDNTDTRSTKRRDRVTKMNTTTQIQAVRAILKAAKCPTGGANDDNTMDSDNDGKDALTFLSNTTVKAKDVVKAAVELARNLAAQAQLGTQKRQHTHNITITGFTFPGNAANIRVNGTNSSIEFPDNFKFDDETSRYSVSTTEFRKNLLGDKGKPEKKTLGSVVVDFLVQNNGQKKDVKDLSSPVKLRIKLTPENIKKLLAAKKEWTKRQKTAVSSTTTTATTAAPSTSTSPKKDEDPTKDVHCRYFDEKTNQWSSNGVTTGKMDDDGNVDCRSTHLSAYAVFVGSGSLSSSDDSNNNNNNGAAAGTSNLSDGQRTALIAGVVGGVALLIAVALFIRARRNSEGTGQVPEGVSMNHMLFAAPAMDYDDEMSMVSGRQTQNEYTGL